MEATETMSLSEIRRKYREGVSAQILADLNGCTKTDIINVLNEDEKDMAEKDRVKWIEWHNAGQTAGDIARRANVSYATIYNWLKKQGLEPNKKVKRNKHETVVQPEQAREHEPVVEPEAPTPLQASGVYHGPAELIEVEYNGIRIAEALKEVSGAMQKISKTIQPDDAISVALLRPPSRDNWERYRIAAIADWIAYCAGNAIPIDAEFIAEYNKAVAS